MAYLKQKGKQQKFWLYKEAEQDKMLGKFWFEGKTRKGEMYTVSSLKCEIWIEPSPETKRPCLQYTHIRVIF